MGETPSPGHLDGGEGLLEAFRALGVDYVFCSPGSEWAPLWEAMARQVTEAAAGPTYLDLLHETLAVGLAIGYAQVSGRMQAVLVHAGPGLLQGSCGIHGALLAEAPMLVLSSEANSYGERASVDPGSQWYRNLSIVGGPHGLVDHIVKWSSQVPGVETLYEFVKRAGEIAERSPRGPVYLNMAVEVLLEAWAPPKFPQAVAKPGRKICPVEDIKYLSQAVSQARRPIILTESAGRNPRASEALLAFAEAYQIPVFEPQGSVCCNFPRSHALHLGSELGPLRDEADLVLLINCRAPWYPPSNRPPNARTIVIDETPQRPYAVYQVLFAERYLEGDVAHTLAAAAALRPPELDVGDRAAMIAARRSALEGERLEAEAKAAAAEGRIGAVRLVSALRQARPDRSIVFDETITHSRLVQKHLLGDDPTGYFYVQGGLGQGIGVALGGKLAAQDRFVCLVIGDGSFLYNPIVQALAASKAIGLPILIVVFNNRKYLSMKFNHLRFYPEGVAQTKDCFFGVNLDDQPDLERFGEPFDMATFQVSAPEALDAALAEAIAEVQSGRTAILNVMLAQ